jgi:hypothetical protein
MKEVGKLDEFERKLRAEGKASETMLRLLHTLKTD